MYFRDFLLCCCSYSYDEIESKHISVGISDCGTSGLSEYRTVRVMGCRIIANVRYTEQTNSCILKYNLCASTGK